MLITGLRRRPYNQLSNWFQSEQSQTSSLAPSPAVEPLMTSWEEAAGTGPRGFTIRCSALHWGWEEVEDSQGEKPGSSHSYQANNDRKAPWLVLMMKKAAKLLRAEPGNSTTPGPPPEPKSQISAMPINTNTPIYTQKPLPQRTQDPLLSIAHTLRTSFF